MRTLLLAALLTLSGALAAPKLVLDGRRAGQLTPGLSETAQFPGDTALVRRLMRAANLKSCDPAVTQKLSGFFTTTAQRETLYLVRNCVEFIGSAVPMQEPPLDLLITTGKRVTLYRRAFAYGVQALPALAPGTVQPVVALQWSGPHMGEFALYGDVYRMKVGAFTRALPPEGHLIPLWRSSCPYEADGTVEVSTLWTDAARPGTLTLRTSSSAVSAKVCAGNREPTFDPRTAKPTHTVTWGIK
ncbi:hypothetical protein [Deinococcus maricopensis]|uniref:Secreted protein n=1 Tax=Deinococcus maricopensis (strain DSM 21211 / LMG 22137 / NRRL B-23946 / LB-34) TaxID=709986 RepID=E8U5U0_DEIML|nr:hypothetical protein [Deinococcus maricopensis]ADV66429.1 hypothetical protein Deima_0773 [Deinococcus maricopensis DSM 21211]